ncbi:MAG: triose-phosphate isomerase [bacterium]|nr:triose-phosphate isomerase [bacterium]
MRRIHVVANWKANLTAEEALVWLDAVGPQLRLVDRVTVCPPFPSLIPMMERAKKRGYFLRFGVQTIDPTPSGAHTGDVTVDQLPEGLELCLVGHSERKAEHGETIETMQAQIVRCREHTILPLVFFEQPSEVSMLTNELSAHPTLVYEPASMISTNNPTPASVKQTIDSIDVVASSLDRLLPRRTIVLYYGGSVDTATLPGIIGNATIAGVVVGHASLEPASFLEIIRDCR